MNQLQTAAVAAALAAGAIASLVHGLRPRRRSIAEVRALLFGGESSKTMGRARSAAASGRSTSFAGSLSGPVLSHLRAATERRLGSGLRLLDRSVDRALVDIVGRIVVSFLVGALTVVAAVASLTTMGVMSPHPVWLLLAPGAGAACAWIMWSDARQRIVRRRRELQLAANDFVQLVALGLTTDQSVEEAIQFALGVGGPTAAADDETDQSDVWEILRQEITTAPQRGVPLWEALDRLGLEYDQRELSELGASIERQGTQGVSITDTVTTMAGAMRARALDELEREADKVNANLAGPTVGFVVAMIVFLAYPLALRITEAFGG